MHFLVLLSLRILIRCHVSRGITFAAGSVGSMAGPSTPDCLQRHGG